MTNDSVKRSIYLATISDSAAEMAQAHALGLELDDFCTAANMDTDFDRWDARTRDFLSRTDRFILHAPFAELSPCAIDPLAREVTMRRLKQAAALCHRYQVRRMVVHSGFIPNVYYPIWFVEQSARFFREFLSSEPEDFQILIENVMDPDPQPMIDMIDAIDDARARMCLDVGHAHAVSNISVREWLRAFAPKLSHLHVHDNDGMRDAHALPGDGTIGFPRLYDDIFSLAPNATLTFECTDAVGCVERLKRDRLI